MYFETPIITTQKDLKFFFGNFFINLILVLDHLLNIGVKFDFQFFEKNIIGGYQVGIFLRSPSDSIGQNLKKIPYM